MSATTKDFRVSLKNGHSLFAREVTHSSSCPAANPTHDPEGDDAFLAVVVHGGPGLNSHEESFGGLQKLLQDWTSSSSDFSATRNSFSRIHALVFYDQLGCGSSDKPPIKPILSLPTEDTNHSTRDDDLYTLSYYVNELQQVIDAVKIRHSNCGGAERELRLCLLGHSWGGQVVLEYLLQQIKQKQNEQTSAVVAIISNAHLNEKTYSQRQKDIRNALPEDIRLFLEQDEQEAANDKTSVSASIYRKLIGVSETNIVGEMAGWDVLTRIHQVSCPCLFITGTKDTIPYEEYEYLQREKLPNPSSRVLILENGEHGPFYGETAHQYFCEIQSFLLSIL